jgi:anti-sigma B factor antagonist
MKGTERRSSTRSGHGSAGRRSRRAERDRKRGEIDILTAPPLSARLDRLTADLCPDLVLDLRSVPFIDCSGLSVLCRARTRVLARRGRLRIVTGDTRFLRILGCAGLAGVFEVQLGMPGAPLLPP